jgi:hypothetical protein
VKAAVFRYRCRRCGELFDGGQTGVDYGDRHLVGVLAGSAGLVPHELHSCFDEGVGIGDLAGYDKREVK